MPMLRLKQKGGYAPTARERVFGTDVLLVRLKIE